MRTGTTEQEEQEEEEQQEVAPFVKRLPRMSK
jgi:hypothetical protein